MGAEHRLVSLDHDDGLLWLVVCACGWHCRSDVTDCLDFLEGHIDQQERLDAGV